MLEPLSPKNRAHSKTTANYSSTSTTTVGMAIKAGMKRKAEPDAIISDMRKNSAALTQRPVRNTQSTKAAIALAVSIAPSRRLPEHSNPPRPNINQGRPTPSASVTMKRIMARRPPVTTSTRPTTTTSSRPSPHSSEPRTRVSSTKKPSSTIPSLSTGSQETGSNAQDHYNSRYQTLTNLLNQFSLYSKKKRPAWDTKGRLEEMDELMAAVYQLMYQEAKRSRGEDYAENGKFWRIFYHSYA